MDIHRCRFVQYPPQSINALAFSHTSEPPKKSPSSLRLAVGRNNGDIELWNPREGLWVQESVLKGSKNTTIEQLAWTQDIILDEDADGSRFSNGPLRLFSTGGSTSVTEWDLCTGSPKKQAEGNFGDIWCLAAQPQIQNAKSQDLENSAGSPLLAAGCSDGTIILFSTEDDDLRYLRSVLAPPVKKPKVLSIAWRDRKTLVAGYEDSTIRVIDVPNRRIVRNMTLGKPVDGNNSVVWTVKCLPDGTILSGDSSGELKIWDSKTYSLVQRIKSHKADILDIATSASGDVLFSLGVDRRTVGYKPVAIHSGTQKKRWAEVSHKRFHQHDVKCSATFESKELSVLVSGGMDAKLVVLPIRRSQSEYHRTLPHLPQRPQISVSPASRLFISWWDRDIMVYHIRKYQNMGENDFDSDLTTGSPYDTLARLVVQGDESIQDARISEDGQLIIAATTSSIKVFQIRKTQTSGRPCLRTRLMELPSSVSRLGARRVGFSPDGKWLYAVRKDNAITLAKIVPSEDPQGRPTIHEKIVHLYRKSRKIPPTDLRTYQQTITQAAFSSDSRVLAVGDLSGAIDDWLLEGHEDVDFADDNSDNSDNSSNSSSSSTSSDEEDNEDLSPVIHGQKWIRNPTGSQLPQLDSSILALTFRPSPLSLTSAPMNGNSGLHPTRHTPHPVSHELPSFDIRLLAVTATHQLVEFDVLNSRLSEWSRRNPSKYLPHDFTRIKDRVVGSFWDSSDVEKRGERLWLYGSSWLFMLDVSQDLQPQEASGALNYLGELEKIGTLGRYDVLDVVKDSPNKRQKLLERSEEQIDRGTNGKTRRKQKRNVGAGDEIRVAERASGIGRGMWKFRNEGDDVKMIDIGTTDEEDGGRHGSDMEDDNEQSEGEDALALIRRGEQDSTDQTSQRPRPSHWHTFGYHSILGIAVIGPPQSQEHKDTDKETAQEDKDDEQLGIGNGNGRGIRTGTGTGNIEVLVVERDIYDVDQVPRFDGGQEWDV